MSDNTETFRVNLYIKDIVLVSIYLAQGLKAELRWGFENHL